MRQSTWRRIIQSRSVVATRCGTATAATASFMSTCRANTGVRTVPIPNPATEAIAPAAIDAAISMASVMNCVSQRLACAALRNQWRAPKPDFTDT